MRQWGQTGHLGAQEAAICLHLSPRAGHFQLVQRVSDHRVAQVTQIRCDLLEALQAGAKHPRAFGFDKCQRPAFGPIWLVPEDLRQ